jgi:antitoxin (DNA-binding transcriptional repressor) of toxin-antitoxin stability system
MFTADNSLGQANPTDVRSGVSYASGNLTGRLTVPARGSVALSVNYGPSMPFTATRSGTTATATLAYSYPLVVGDSITVTGASNSEWNSTYTIASVVSGTSVTFTVPATHSATAGAGATMQTAGTAVLDPAAVASAVWGAATRTLTGGGISASDVWDYATRSLTTSSGPTAVEIRQELDSNSTKLANLDAPVSSRLAPSGTLAAVTTLTNAPTVPTAAAIADEVRVELATELARIDAPISAAGNAPSASTVATAVRTELATELARVDAAVSSRATAANIPTADITAIKSKTDNLPASPAATGDIPSANITAIKAKTDMINTDRLAQVSTVSTTGAQLAAALS